MAPTQKQARMVWGIQGAEDIRWPPTLQENHPRNCRKALLGVASQQGVEGSGMAGPGEILRSPWIP
jgi:hypothetical protein